MKGFRQNAIVTVTHNESGTHFYADGTRIAKNDALLAIEEYNKKFANSTVATASGSASVAIQLKGLVQSVYAEPSISKKAEILKQGVEAVTGISTSTVKFLVSLLLKSENAKGFGVKSADALLKKDVSLFAKELDEKRLISFICDTLKVTTVFSLTKIQQNEIMAIVPFDLLTTIAGFIGRDFKLGMSDAQITDVLNSIKGK